MTTRTITMLSAVAALAARPVTSEDEAITELTALTPEVTRLRAFASAVSTRLGGETDPEKAAARITELATSVATYKGQAEAAEAARLDGVVESALKQHEDRITPAIRPILGASLRAELSAAGATLEKAPTFLALGSMPKHGLTQQSTEADTGSGSIPGAGDPEAVLERKKDEILASDPEVVALKAKDPQAAIDLAYDKAAAAVRYQSPQQLRAI